MDSLVQEDGSVKALSPTTLHPLDQHQDSCAHRTRTLTNPAATDPGTATSELGDAYHLLSFPNKNIFYSHILNIFGNLVQFYLLSILMYDYQKYQSTM